METIRLDEFLNYHFLSNLQLSPNAHKAAFVVSKSNEDRDGYAAGIWTVDLQTKACRPLTAGKDERSFLWMDDETILFASKRNSKKEEVDSTYTDYYSISLCGGEAQKKMTVPAAVSAIKKLGKGKYLVCADYDNHLPENFMEMDRAARAKVLADRKKEKDYEMFTELPFWRNGGGITDKHRDRLYLFDSCDGSMKPLTGPLYLLEGYSLSKDCNKLVYFGSEFTSVQSLKQELVEVDLVTGNSEVLIPMGSWDIHRADYAGDQLMVVATENKNYGINETPTSIAMTATVTACSWSARRTAPGAAALVPTAGTAAASRWSAKRTESAGSAPSATGRRSTMLTLKATSPH